MPKILFTKEGLENFKHELEKNIKKRPEYVENLRVAREMGDLSENAAYKVARQALSRLDSRIRYLENIINSGIIFINTSNFINIGNTVTLRNDLGNIVKYTIVGKHEVNLLENKISYISPLGKALINKKKDDIVNVYTPNGLLKYSIINIA